MELSTKSDEMSLASLVDAEEVRSTCCLLLFFYFIVGLFLLGHRYTVRSRTIHFLARCTEFPRGAGQLSRFFLFFSRASPSAGRRCLSFCDSFSPFWCLEQGRFGLGLLATERDGHLRVYLLACDEPMSQSIPLWLARPIESTARR